MEQDTSVATPVANNNKKNKEKTWKIIAIVTSVLAICGIGFGIYGMTQSSQKERRISDLETQIDGLNNKSSSLETDSDNTSASGGMEDGSADVADGNSKDFIIVGEFGFKIKKPENWRDLVSRYTYYNDYPHAVDTFEIMENESVATSHAMISLGNGNCKDDEWTDCVEIQIGEESTLDVRVPKSNSDLVSESFRNWITNSDNYSKN